MDEFNDSDVTMLATDSFSKIMQQIQNSSLNYQLKLTPFSATVSIKKSLIKDRSGKPILPTSTKMSCCTSSDFSSSDDSKCSKLRNDLNLSQLKQEELSRELTASYETIRVLKGITRIFFYKKVLYKKARLKKYSK